MTAINKNEKEELLAVLSLYDFDLKNPKIVRDTNGFVNKIYFISTLDKKLVLRKSNSITSLSHIKLEVKLLDYLSAHNFASTPKIITNLKGDDVTVYNQSFFTLQTFMPGGIKASWNNLKYFTPARTSNFFQTVALFSRATEKFPRVNSLTNRPAWYFVKNGPALLNKLYKSLPKTTGKKLILKNYQDILKFIAQTHKEFIQTDYDSLPKQLVHFDFHPGNVNYLKDKVVALFDFDWARYDARFSDLASGIGQSCYYYGGKHGGYFRKDQIKRAMQSYQKAYGKSPFSKKKEIKYIKVAVRGYVIYIFFWALDLYKKNSTQENFLILDHFLKILLLNEFDQLFD